jgi:dTDP-glucose 4,6-dehydratase
MKIFVTGGAGFIGSHFVRHVLSARNEYSVVNFDKLTYAGNLANLEAAAQNPSYKFVKGGVCEAKALEEAMHGCNAIVHFAAESHVDRSIYEPDPAIETNINGTFALLQAARKLGTPRFVHVSTDEVYGDIPEGVFSDEDSPLNPSSPYAASKAAADLLVLSWVRTYMLPAIIVRPSNNYGPNQFPEKLLPLMITNALEGAPLPIYGDGMQQRNWLHVEDNCRAILAVLEGGRVGEVYNAGGADVETNLALVRRVLQIMGKPEALIRHVEDRPGHDRRYALNSAKIARELGWKPAIALDEGLRQTVAWYAANQAWVASLKQGRRDDPR